ncbi:MAG TPA: DUF721 domain-containing protein [Gaiellaceae bacterium]|nr:DUF721 domain-containing protein [Gaiellaceae bacterium]
MRRIGDAVGRELTRLGPQGAIADVVAAWPAAVGDGIARNAWPARIARDRTLHVATASSAWAFELAQLAPTVLERLRAALRAEIAPSSLRFAPGPLPSSSPATPVESSTVVRRAAAPTPEEAAFAHQLASSIGDDELRTLVARAAAASLARRSL